MALTVMDPVPATAEEVLLAYETLRPVLPRATFGATTACLPDLGPLAERYDVFLFDAFGVLNLGNTVIDGARERLRALREQGKQVLMVSNAGSFPAPRLVSKYRSMGLGFTEQTLVCSREVLLSHLQLAEGEVVGVMAPDGADLSDLDDLNVPYRRLHDDPSAYRTVQAMVLLGSGDWSVHRQALLQQALIDHPRPLWVANADLVAPWEHGFSLEPGWYARGLSRSVNLPIHYFGKPHRPIFAAALQRAAYTGPAQRVLMVGDTLHTDILGAKAIGFDAALVTGQGASHGLDLEAAIASTGIRPDYVVPSI